MLFSAAEYFGKKNYPEIIIYIQIGAMYYLAFNSFVKVFQRFIYFVSAEH